LSLAIRGITLARVERRKTQERALPLYRFRWEESPFFSASKSARRSVVVVQGAEASSRVRAALRGARSDIEIVELPDSASLDLPSRAIADASSLTRVVQAVLQSPARLWLITRGAASISGAESSIAPDSAALRSMARAIAAEQAELSVTSVDLDPDDATGDALLLGELLGESEEREIAFRGSARLVSRMAPGEIASLAPRKLAARADDAAFSLERDGEDVLLGEIRPAPPGSGEIAVRVRAAALSPAHASSFWCAGEVIAIGDGVSEFRAGDAVVALGTDAPASCLIVPAARAIGMPSTVGWTDAVLLSSFAIAGEALENLAGLRPGDVVSIHSLPLGIDRAAAQ
jgi:hypothetical protein